ncbi:hypothetical protein OG389_29655 [Streptomyces sp. NBC_00435]
MSADTAVDRGSVYRHPIRYARLRLDAAIEDVPRFSGAQPEAAPGQG